MITSTRIWQPRAPVDKIFNILEVYKGNDRMSEPQLKKVKMSSSLAQLKEMTTVVADTGDFEGKEIII